VRQEFEIDLVADAKSGRNDAQSLEGLRAPLQEPIPLAVPAELHLRVEAECVRAAEVVDLHGMIDHQIDGHQRLDTLDVETTTCDRRTHRCQIDEQWNTGEILKEHATHDERDFCRTRGSGLPSSERFDILLTKAPAVDMTEHGFKDDAHTHGQARDASNPKRLELRERVVRGGCSGRELQSLAYVDHGSLAAL
jgi:hypothetical protein